METKADHNKDGMLQQQRAMWDQQEAARIQSQGEASVKDTAYLKYKLYFYSSLEVKFDPPTTLQDKLQLELLKLDKQKLEKQLYPNWVERQLARLVSRWIEMPKLKREHEQRLEGQTSALRQALRRTGLSSTVEQLQLDFSSGVAEMKAPVSFRTGPDERMDLKLQFRRDKEGNMQFPYYEATLKDLINPAGDRSYTFRVDKQQGFDVKEAYNLLKGRAVKRSFVNAEGKTTSEWVQLNFKEKGPDGNYVMDRFPSGYGFDLYAAVPAWLQFNEHLSAEQQQTIMAGLQKGNRESFKLPVGGKTHTYYIEADPRSKSVQFYDNRHQPVKVDLQRHIAQKQNEAQRPARRAIQRERMPQQQLAKGGPKL
jgi:hypothetical protein